MANLPAKSIFRIDRSHIQRAFIGTQTPAKPNARWLEAGHFYVGFDLMVKPVMEQDSLARASASIPGYGSLGYIISGSCQPAQNDDAAITFNTTVMNGVCNVALLTQFAPNSPTARLILFRLVSQGGGNYQDNRFSINTAQHYTSQNWRWESEFSGWIPNYEHYIVIPSSVKLNGPELLFTATDTISGGGGIPISSIGNSQ